MIGAHHSPMGAAAAPDDGQIVARVDLVTTGWIGRFVVDGNRLINPARIANQKAATLVRRAATRIGGNRVDDPGSAPNRLRDQRTPSMTIAIPIPPPMQSAATPRPPPRCFSA